MSLVELMNFEGIKWQVTLSLGGSEVMFLILEAFIPNLFDCLAVQAFKSFFIACNHSLPSHAGLLLLHMYPYGCTLCAYIL